MNQFPYLEILRKAYELTHKHSWLWVFGFFITGTSVFNTGSLNLFFPPPPRQDLLIFKENYIKFLHWAIGNPQLFFTSAIIALIILAALVILSGLALSSSIWAVSKLTESQNLSKKIEGVDFRKTLRAGRAYFWRILGLQILITLGFVSLFLILSIPTAYLFFLQYPGRAVILLLLGLLIFIPGMLVFGFLHLYGPIFVVLYDKNIREALVLSFNLFRAKFRESIILAAFLVGLNVLFIMGLVFSIIVLCLPIALLIWLLVNLQFFLGAQTLVIGTIILVLALVISMIAGFAVFQNTTWVMAVQEMVKTQKTKEPEEAYLVEPA